MIISSNFAEAKVEVVMKSVKDSTHVELTGFAEWRYDVRHDLADGHNHFAIQFKGVKATELAKLTGLTDSRVKSVAVKDGIDGDALVEFELIGRTTNLFDYQ